MPIQVTDLAPLSVRRSLPFFLSLSYFFFFFFFNRSFDRAGIGTVSMGVKILRSPLIDGLHVDTG